MEIGLVLTLCGLGIAFSDSSFILGMILGNKCAMHSRCNSHSSTHQCK